MKRTVIFFVFVLLSLMSSADRGTASFQHKQFCEAQFNDRLERFLCVASRTLLESHPVGKFSLFILDSYFGGPTDNNKPKPWDMVRADVEKLVSDRFEKYQIKTLTTWQKSISARITSCRLKINLDIKRSCYKNLQEDLAGFEPVFKGSSGKEKILFVKHYDIYVATFMSVSFLLRDISGDILKASIERDIKHKAKIFADHLNKILPLVKAYACRHIKIKLMESYIFWEEERFIWPNYSEITKYIQPGIDQAYVMDALHNQTRGEDNCRLLDTTNKYIANIIDARDSSEYPGGKVRGSYCRNSLAIRSLVPTKYDIWKVLMKMCFDDHGKSSLGLIKERLKFLNELL